MSAADDLAAAVAAERERCAQICEGRMRANRQRGQLRRAQEAKECAQAIRESAPA